MRNIQLPYANTSIGVSLPEAQVSFTGSLPPSTPLPNWAAELARQLDAPTAGPPLASFLSPGRRVLLLVEDQTRHTPVRELLPPLCGYLMAHGIAQGDIHILIAPGTHRPLTEAELAAKLGPYALGRFAVMQHDYRAEASLVKLGSVMAAGIEIPVAVNRALLEADVVIGMGNIVPHPNAGFSGGAKILDPGCCGFATVSATHMAAALLGYLPLGVAENACRASMETVAERAGLKFIVNVVLNGANQVVRVVTGDMRLAHRAGCEAARAAFGVPIPAPADVLISCSYPYASDFWQCEKALISGYFAVKEGGIIILAAPCLEGLVHNHDGLLAWAQLSYAEANRRIRQADPADPSLDIVAAGIAMGAALVREKASIFIYAPGLTEEQTRTLGYTSFPSVQAAVDEALRRKPGASIGVLPRGGDCLPLVE